jgi:ELWxxDGT repeat protein
MKKFFLLLPFIGFFGALIAQTPAVLKDIYNFETLNSSPAEHVSIGNTIYFSADDGFHGIELWKTDGTLAGTTMVKDINPGRDGSIQNNFAFFTNWNGTLYFAANGGIESGVELWKSDGTEAGTVMVKDINVGVLSSSPAYFTAVNGVLMFRALTPANGVELWKTDGTNDGTVLVKDILTGTSSSNPVDFTLVDGELFFSAPVTGTTTSNRELWKSNGTADGTVLVKDIIVGPVGSNPTNLVNLNGTLYFQASNGAANGSELWKSDGTDGGTQMVKDINPGAVGSSPNSFNVVGNNLFFFANNGINGFELWKSDGTDGGTVLVKDINPGNASGVGQSTDRITAVLGNTLYFRANNGVNGVELWKSNGTEAGTVMVRDINPGVAASNPDRLTEVNGQLFFRALNPTNGTALWQSNGTEGGTIPVNPAVLDNSTYLDKLIAHQNKLYFVRGGFKEAFPATATGREMWVTDGTNPGTNLIKDINTNTQSSSPYGFLTIGNTTYFGADDGLTGVELWKTNGTEAGTVLVKDLVEGITGSQPSNFTDVNGTLFFTAIGTGQGRELWKSDGTAAGTVLVKDIIPGSNGSIPDKLTNVNGTLFFTANFAGLGIELWKSDGTELGTVLVKDIVPGPVTSRANKLTAIGNTLFFTAQNGTTSNANDEELWKSDGTSEGTVLVKDIRPGTLSSIPNLLTNFNGTLFFTANNGTNGLELWKSNGTEAGTTMIELVPGATGSAINGLYVMGNTLYFSATQDAFGSELFKTNGTAEGTGLVKDIRPGGNGSSPRNMIQVGNKLFFIATENGTAWNIYQTDGTSDGTVIVKAAVPFASGTFGSDYTAINNHLYFQINSSTVGIELYKTDGTSEGSVIFDLFPGTGSGDQNHSRPSFLTQLGNKLIFSAFEPATGNEVWVLDAAPPAVTFTWTGAISTAWENPANWSGNAVPTENADVLLPGSMPRYPVVNASTTINKITCNQGSSIQLAPGVVLLIKN